MYCKLIINPTFNQNTRRMIQAIVILSSGIYIFSIEKSLENKLLFKEYSLGKTLYYFPKRSSPFHVTK